MARAERWANWGWAILDHVEDGEHDVDYAEPHEHGCHRSVRFACKVPKDTKEKLGHDRRGPHRCVGPVRMHRAKLAAKRECHQKRDYDPTVMKPDRVQKMRPSLM